MASEVLSWVENEMDGPLEKQREENKWLKEIYREGVEMKGMRWRLMVKTERKEGKEEGASVR